MTILQDKILGPGGALDELAALDADIAAAVAQYGPPPDRSLPANFDTLARSVIGQQISRSAASTIWQRMRDQSLSTADTIASMSPAALMPVGLSQRKAEYLIGIANEVTSGQLDFDALQHLSGDAVQARLIKIRGIGAWTADNIRLFAPGAMHARPVNGQPANRWNSLVRAGSPTVVPGPWCCGIFTAFWSDARRLVISRRIDHLAVPFSSAMRPRSAG